jgi:hypothetical protein
MMLMMLSECVDSVSSLLLSITQTLFLAAFISRCYWLLSEPQKTESVRVRPKLYSALISNADSNYRGDGAGMDSVFFHTGSALSDVLRWLSDKICGP